MKQHNQPGNSGSVDKLSIFPDTIIVGPDFTRREVGPYCYWRAAASFQRFNAMGDGWKASPSTSISLEADQTHWIFGLLKNNASVDKTLKLYLNHVQTGPVYLYVFENGKCIDTAITGSIIPVKKRATMDRALSFVIVVPAGKVVEIYIRAERREIDMTFALLFSDMAFDKELLWEDSALLVALSFIFIILITSSTVVFYAPGIKALSFLVYILFGLLYVFAASGYGSL